MVWPIAWPEAADIGSVDPNIRRLAELYASTSMTMLTLHRVGGTPVTIYPGALPRKQGRYAYWTDTSGVLLGAFYPLDRTSALDLHAGWLWRDTAAIDLPGPVGAITNITITGTTLDPGAYRVEDGRWLVRTDGGAWPSGEDFTVSYYNSHEVDEMGAHAGGVLAVEFLKLLTQAKGCRLPGTVTNVVRQGLTFEVAKGMFPDGLTSLPEVDAYTALYNPWGHKVAPRVYSPDLPQYRQRTWP